MKRSVSKRLAVFLLSAAVAFTMMPWFGAQKVYADTPVSSLYDKGTITIDMTGYERYYFDEEGTDPYAFVNSLKIMNDNGIAQVEFDLSDPDNAAFWVSIDDKGTYDFLGGSRMGGDSAYWFVHAAEEHSLTTTPKTLSIPSDATFDEYSVHLLSPDGITCYYSKIIIKFPTITGGKATLGYTRTTWSGSAKKPSVKVKVKGETVDRDEGYSVTYRNNKNVGKATVTIRGNHAYQGVITKTFIINPAGTTLKTATSPSKGAIKATWNKQAKLMSTSHITGYQIQVATDKNFTKNVKTFTSSGYSKDSKKMTGLKSGKKYYVRIRTFKTVSGTKYTSTWSKAKTVTVK